jgi:hypothetical protein
MNGPTNTFSSKSYSFLAWLAVPLLLAWIGSSYLIGSLTVRPAWAGGTIEAPAAPTPFVKSYPAIAEGSNGMVTLWFDDAWISQYMIAAPILKSAGFMASIAVPTGMIGYPSFANWAQLRALQRDGWEVVNHSVAHDCSMEEWTPEKLQKEFTDSTNELWRQKLTSDIFVSPCGVNSPGLIGAVEKNFTAFRGTEPGYNNIHDLDVYDLHVRNITNTTTLGEIKGWITDAQKQNLWVILVFHQVGDPDEVGNGEKYSISTEEFKEMVEYIKTSPIQVVLPTQALSLRTSNE